MKPIKPLIVVFTAINALMATNSVFAQSSPPGGGMVVPGRGGTTGQGEMAGRGEMSRLTHEDSLVLAEAAGADSLARVDSLLHSRIRVLTFPAAINAVLKDFPFNLRNITGELVLAQGEFENYASMVELPGAENCIVTRYHSADDTTASWQAKMFSSEDFTPAARAYHELFRKLQGCYLQLVDGSVVYLKGDWEPAREETPFTTSTLRLMTGDWRYKEVKVELELVYQLADWAVHINIVTKKRDDEVGGKGVADNQ